MVACALGASHESNARKATNHRALRANPGCDNAEFIKLSQFESFGAGDADRRRIAGGLLCKRTCRAVELVARFKLPAGGVQGVVSDDLACDGVDAVGGGDCRAGDGWGRGTLRAR